jgi:hypothetical protein
VICRTDYATGVQEVLTVDAASGEVRIRFPILDSANFRGIGADGRSLLVVISNTDRWAAVRGWLERLGLHGYRPDNWALGLIDPATGRRLHSLPLPVSRVKYAADGKSLVQLGSRGEITIWDIPPRKPLTRFALAAAVLALPLAGLAWRRSRRLRREVA